MTSIHPPEDSIKLTSHIIASPYKDNSQVKNNNQIHPGHISAVIEQNNYTNLHLKTISNQTERIENTICKALTLTNTYHKNKKGKYIIETEPLIIKPITLSKTINLEKRSIQLPSKSNFLSQELEDT